jgi:eukaryotic-like serine/threonine-protein kinase
MKSALEFDAMPGAMRRVPFAPLGERYSIVGKLRGTGRAEVSLCLPSRARSIDELVVIKVYGSGPIDGQGRVGLPPEVDIPAEAIPPEVEVASTPRHHNLARVVECGWESGRHFIISEYLDGTTLRRLLRWLAARGETLPNAAIARILLGMFAAVEHANQWARTPRARALVHQPIDATDVFITPTGAVKVLGFKPQKLSDGASLPTGSAAVDDLLSTQRSVELAAVLARIGNRLSSSSLIGLWQVARMLMDWQQKELRSDGDAELAQVMASVEPERRALRRARLEAAVERVLRARDEAEPAADAPPTSGFRVVGSGGESAAIIRCEPLRELESPLPTLVVGGPEVVSHLQRTSRTPPRGPTPTGMRRRVLPLASLLVFAGVFTAGLVVSRQRGRQIQVTESTLAPGAPLAPAPSVDHGAPATVEPRTTRGPILHAELESTPASRLPAVVAPIAASSSAPWRHTPRERRPGNASLLRAPARGYLTLDTTPWSTVTVSGVSLGQTPLVKVELRPGQHLLELANEELGIATSVVVEIASGTTTVRRIGLERPIQAARQ